MILLNLAHCRTEVNIIYIFGLINRNGFQKLLWNIPAPTQRAKPKLKGPSSAQEHPGTAGSRLSATTHSSGKSPQIQK